MAVEKLIKEEPERPERSPFHGDAASEEIWGALLDKNLAELITEETGQLNNRTWTAFEEMVDKVEIDNMLREILNDDEQLYDLPPLHATRLVKKVPDANENWERFNVLLYLTNKHLFIFNATMSTGNRIERTPILGALELARYEVINQRVDDMIMIPIPMNNIKGYSLDVKTVSHAKSFISKQRLPMCLVLALVCANLCVICALAGRYKVTMPVLGMDSTTSADTVLELPQGSSNSWSESASWTLAGSDSLMTSEWFESVENTSEGRRQLQSVTAQPASGTGGDPQWVVDLVNRRWYFFTVSLLIGLLSSFWLINRPSLELSPPHPQKIETRRVCIGAKEPLMQKHMILELDIDDDYKTTDCKEFLRVMQLNAAHLAAELISSDF
eukprot:SAG31_NODE_4175_length_3507_cov_2.044894_3_plen_385_part_00